MKNYDRCQSATLLTLVDCVLFSGIAVWPDRREQCCTNKNFFPCTRISIFSNIQTQIYTIFLVQVSTLCARILLLFLRKFRYFIDVFCTILCKFSHGFSHFFTLPKFTPKQGSYKCKILFIVFDILEIKITDEDSDQS